MNIQLTREQKIQVATSDDMFKIMLEILLHEEKIDQEKEHFWLVGLALNNCIQNIELVSLGSVKSINVEPMNVFRIAVIKGSAKVIMVHNHPSGDIKASLSDIDTTDRLFQVGRILNIPVVEHMIISTTDYFSFLYSGLLAEIEKSDKYIPKYEMIERIRAEEKKIRAQAVQEAAEKNLDKGIKRGLKQGLEEGLLKGKKTGGKEKQTEIAKNLKHMGLADELIMQATGLTKAAIQKL